MKRTVLLPSFLASAAMALTAAFWPGAAGASFEIRGMLPSPAAAAPVVPSALPDGPSLAPIGMMPDSSGRARIPVTAVPIGPPVSLAPEMPMSADGRVDGFGQDLPLAIAVQQIVPAGYRMSFAPDVPAGQRVSWQGGDHWQNVLAAMLRDQGLSYDVRDGTVITIRRAVVESAPRSAQVTPPGVRPAPGGGVVPAASPQTVEIRRPRGFAGFFGRGRDRRYNDAPALAGLRADERVSTPEETAPQPISLVKAPPSPMEEPALLSPQSFSLRGTGEAMQAPLRAPAFEARAGQTLRDVLQAWASRAGVTLYWSIDYDYRLTKDVAFDGSFAEATAHLLNTFTRARPRPYAQLHQGPEASPALVIRAYGVSH